MLPSITLSFQLFSHSSLFPSLNLSVAHTAPSTLCVASDSSESSRSTGFFLLAPPAFFDLPLLRRFTLPSLGDADAADADADVGAAGGAGGRVSAPESVVVVAEVVVGGAGRDDESVVIAMLKETSASDSLGLLLAAFEEPLLTFGLAAHARSCSAACKVGILLTLTFPLLFARLL